MGSAKALLAALALLCGGASWSPQPWLDDLAQIRVALDEKYANRDWLTGERGVDLDALFARTAARLRAARDEAEARAALGPVGAAYRRRACRPDLAKAARRRRPARRRDAGHGRFLPRARL